MEAKKLILCAYALVAGTGASQAFNWFFRRDEKPIEMPPPRFESDHFRKRTNAFCILSTLLTRDFAEYLTSDSYLYDVCYGNELVHILHLNTALKSALSEFVKIGGADELVRIVGMVNREQAKLLADDETRNDWIDCVDATVRYKTNSVFLAFGPYASACREDFDVRKRYLDRCVSNGVRAELVKLRSSMDSDRMKSILEVDLSAAVGLNFEEPDLSASPETNVRRDGLQESIWMQSTLQMFDAADAERERDAQLLEKRKIAALTHRLRVSEQSKQLEMERRAADVAAFIIEIGAINLRETMRLRAQREAAEKLARGIARLKHKSDVVDASYGTTLSIESDQEDLPPVSRPSAALSSSASEISFVAYSSSEDDT
jgi:hypothetical protein